MKIRINILSLLLILNFLCGCSADESLLDTLQVPSGPEQAQVVLSISVPEVSLPLASDTRAITDDKAISNLAVWAFDKSDKFLYQLTSEKDNDGNSKVIQRGNTIYVLLPKSEDEVTLAIIANWDFSKLKEQEPKPGTAKEDALNGLTFEFSANTSSIPMYGESNPFVVKEGAKPGVIRLTRALAKVEVNIKDILEDFELKAVTIVNANKIGTCGTASASSERVNVTTDALSSTSWVGYMPAGAIDKDTKATRTTLVLKGVNKKNGDGKLRYYRLDFIDRWPSSEIKYITSIERNKRYTFNIQYMAPDMGSPSFDEAVTKEHPDNYFTFGGIMTIDDEEIRDITTDNQYYLGVTSSDISAVMNPLGDKKYYTANMNVLTNDPAGWKIEDLPADVIVNVARGVGGEKITSVWIYIDKAKYNPDQELTLYVYSGHIRKPVRVKIA